MSDGLAAGITDLGRITPVSGPYLGGGNTAQGQAADGQAIQQWEVLAYNAAGRLVPLSAGGGDYATGAVTFGANPLAAETLVINGQAITFVASGATGFQVNIGATATDTAQATKNLINANPGTFGCVASGTGTVLTLTATALGTAGNAVTLTETVVAAGFTVSGATLTGGTAAVEEVGNPVAIAAQAVVAATPGSKLPIFVSGRFDGTDNAPVGNRLIWPAGILTLDQRRLAFAGTPIFVVAPL
jgi:hypothetical protein